MKRQRNRIWENTIKELLGDDNPCEICLIKVTCEKSFKNNTSCEKLAQKLNEALGKITNENKT